MPDQAGQRVSCPGCGKGYRWQASLAGRVVPCKRCGSRFSVPDSPGVGVALESVGDGGTYELDTDDADQALRHVSDEIDGACPGCMRPVKAHAVICVGCGFDIAAGNALRTAVGGPVDDHHDTPTHAAETGKPAGLLPDDPDVLRRHVRAEFVYPLALLIAAAVLTLVNAFAVAPFSPRFDAGTSTVAAATTTLGYTLVITLSMAATQFLAMLLLVTAYGSGFGDVRTLLLKLPALALAGAALTICFVMLYENWLASQGVSPTGHGRGRFKGVLTAVACYLSCFPAMRLFFDADATEANAVVVGSLIGAAVGTLLCAVMFV